MKMKLLHIFKDPPKPYELERASKLRVSYWNMEKQLSAQFGPNRRIVRKLFQAIAVSVQEAFRLVRMKERTYQIKYGITWHCSFLYNSI